ncbi:methionine ABC transporter permease [Liquorilactobacillus hordei]|uniref:ABC-type metal ion transport system, permease component n=1 Tax=Liquorilactobacillus hordei DSM 19519 TaxID=1423759 RepID=A0A0R1MII6_9LACO|nr:methionine ABC transporter permease [Liquorilactobacillus hordei]KRL07853.1 ABC-type metal ion transport system, permease component [Liquorilactobacillus hordei DSM 19519]QYH52104.1 ABC transporter permease [Liquorilactobacillus hordei DSM 19519]
MADFFAKYLPNVVSQGWSGDGGWLTAIGETFYMIFWPAVFGGLLGLSFGIGLVLTDSDGILPNKTFFSIFDKIVSFFRAIPFIILLALIAPVTHFLVGTQIGTLGALVPLSLGLFPFYARQVQVALKSVDHGIIEAAQSIGATFWDLIFEVYLREARSELIRVTTVTMISLVGLTAMAGAVGAGGLGNMAIAYGYGRFANDITFIATFLVLVIVLAIQLLGDFLAKVFNHKSV